MNEGELNSTGYRKEGHETIVTAIKDFGNLGYLVSGISHKNGVLEVVCYPPDQKQTGDSRPLAMDGLSESFSSTGRG